MFEENLVGQVESNIWQ